MSVDWYFIWFALGPAGVLFALAALPIAIYSVFARNPRHGAGASRWALGLSLLAVLVSALLWVTMISGHERYGEPVDYKDGSTDLFEGIIFLEALALLMGLAGALRQSLRRKSNH